MHKVECTRDGEKELETVFRRSLTVLDGPLIQRLAFYPVHDQKQGQYIGFCSPS
jgi:hypothetical protein